MRRIFGIVLLLAILSALLGPIFYEIGVVKSLITLGGAIAAIGLTLFSIHLILEG